jgi:predicted TIM-barrel fold metal-dependent hydrolase
LGRSGRDEANCWRTAGLMATPSRIVDAHHHLWDLQQRHHYPWLMERGVVRFFGNPALIQKDYLVSDFREDIADLPVCKSVHVQVGVSPGDEVAESKWLGAHAGGAGLPTAIVAFADLCAPNLPYVLDAHGEVPQFRGVRQIIGRSSEEDKATGSANLLDNPQFLQGLAILAERGLSFDLQLIPAQMMRAADLLAKVEHLPVAICHAGSLSSFSPESFSQWRRGMRKLAELPHTICKVSGFGMFDKRWSVQSVTDQLRVVLDLFGPERIAFGSNFPVDSLATTYQQVWARFAQLAGSLDQGEVDSVHAGTAEAFYRI